jgi:hypothetical protein
MMTNDQHRSRNLRLLNRLLNSSIDSRQRNRTCGDSRLRLPALSGAEGSVRAQPGLLASSTNRALPNRAKNASQQHTQSKHHSAPFTPRV